MQLTELCQRVYRVAPSDPATALCIAGDIDTENAKDFGFCDKYLAYRLTPQKGV
jgi:hypothetical protein